MGILLMQLNCINKKKIYSKMRMVARRNTENKQRILALLQKNHTMSAQEIMDALPNLVASVVYRILDQFMKDGVVRALPSRTGLRFEHAAERQHDHFVCESCERFFELAIDKKRISAMLPLGAVPGTRGVIVYGVCRTCR